MTTYHPTAEIIAHHLRGELWTGYTKPTSFFHSMKREKMSNSIYVTQRETSSANGTHGLYETDETFEILLYSSDFTAHAELLRIMRAFGNDGWAKSQCDGFEDNLDNWTSITATRSTTSKKTGTYSLRLDLDDTGTWTLESSTTRIMFETLSNSAPGADMSVRFYNDSTLLIQIWWDGTQRLYCSDDGADTQICASVADTWYNVDVRDNGNGTYDVYVDSVLGGNDQKKKSSSTLAINKIVVGTAVNGWDYVYIDDITVYGCEVYRPRKYVNPFVTFLGLSPADERQGVWRMIYKYNSLVSV